MKYLIDPTNGKQSVSLTLFVTGFLIACLKLLFSGAEIGPLTLSPFSGIDFAAVVGALGSIYAVRRTKTKEKEKSE